MLGGTRPALLPGTYSLRSYKHCQKIREVNRGFRRTFQEICADMEQTTALLTAVALTWPTETVLVLLHNTNLVACRKQILTAMVLHYCTKGADRSRSSDVQL